MSTTTDSHRRAAQLKAQLDNRFFKKGLTVAILSGICYGLYTAFMTLGMARGVWIPWMSAETVLSLFVVTYILSAMGSALNDTCSAIWCLIIAAMKGKLGDFFRTLRTKPGIVMICAALVGGPIASTCYVIGLQQAGSLAVPISALCPALGAILARVLFKQPLTPRMLLGIGICFLASFMIASTSLGGDASPGMALGLILAFGAALGWGLEGCIAGYGTSMIDYQIGITIRQCTSGLSNLIILLPLMSLVGGEHAGYAWQLVGQAVSDGRSIIFFVISGFFAVYAYSLWYKGNSMCGAALGMACNGAFSFWGPFFCWLVLGVVCGEPGWNIAPIGWVAAVVMIVGIFIIAVNPLDYLKKKRR